MSADRVRVAFHGELGAEAEDALQQLFGASAEALACSSYRAAAETVLRAEAEHLLVPLENTLTGGVGEVHDLIDAYPTLHATAETVVAVHHCLLGAPEATLDTIRSVLVHPETLPQCARFFGAHPRMETHPVFEATTAARDVAHLADPAYAVVTGRAAAARYPLAVVVADIDDRHDNQTRYLALSPARAVPEVGTPVRTMLVFTTLDTPGALLHALHPFSEHGVNLRRLESRPTGNPWSYRFFVEFDHEVGNPHVDAALDDLRTHTAAVRIVGTYPRWQAGRRGSIGWSRDDLPIIA
jgi:prephenate dehydratase